MDVLELLSKIALLGAVAGCLCALHITVIAWALHRWGAGAGPVQP
jgi:hypothetical protein